MIHALLYIDPGSGSYIIQALVAAVLAAVFWIRSFWRRSSHKHAVVFYAENKNYYQYFERLITDLLEKKVKIHYITSDKQDPLLQNAPEGMQVMHVKWSLGFLFKKMKADVMVMTMPDLDNFLFKRSPGVGKYIYLFHAAVSTHQQYRKEAFFHYDTIFCTGDYQEKEIRKAEELYRQPAKEIVRYGYPLLDTIKEQVHLDTRQVILVAPSWFDGCIFDTCIEELLSELSKLPYEVVLRYHPEYKKRKKESYLRINKLMESHPHMMLDEEPDVIKTLTAADILITDRSGIALEYAFGNGKPVLFVETVLKQTNSNAGELGITPLENAIRHEIGISIAPGQLDQLPEKIKALEQFETGFSERMDALKKDLFYNSTESYHSGVDYILQQVTRK